MWSIVFVTIVALGESTTQHCEVPAASFKTMPACIPGQNSGCTCNAKCVECFGETHCIRDYSLDPFTTCDTSGLIVTIVAVLLAAAAGIGGGGLNVPIFLLAWRFNLYNATKLSHVLIFGNSVGQVIINSFNY